GSENVPSAAVVATCSVPWTRTMTPAIGAWLPSVTTPAMLRVGGGAGGAGRTRVSWSCSGVLAPSTGICRARKPSAVTAIVTFVTGTFASLNVPSAAVVTVSPPPDTATVAFATGLPSRSTIAPVISRVAPCAGGAGGAGGGCGGGCGWANAVLAHSNMRTIHG